MLKINVSVVNKDKESLLPKRSTQYSAGYDVFAPKDLTIEAKQTYAFELPFSFLSEEETKGYNTMHVVRSSYGIKKKLRIVNNNGEYLKKETVSFHEKDRKVRIYNDSDENLFIPRNEHFLQFLLVKEDDKNLDVSFEDVSPETAEANPSIGFTLTEEGKLYALSPNSPITFLPFEQRILSTGYKASFEKGAWLGANIHASFENSLFFANATPVIDADYYNNENNEGLIFLGIMNKTGETLIVGANETLCEFKARPFYLLNNDIATDKERTGGIGSTSKS